jgi:hypothetical protein
LVDIYDRSIESITKFSAKVIKAIQHDRFHVAVGLLENKAGEAKRSGWYRASGRKKRIAGDQLLTFKSSRILGESSCGFIFYSMGGGVDQALSSQRM